MPRRKHTLWRSWARVWTWNSSSAKASGTFCSKARKMEIWKETLGLRNARKRNANRRVGLDDTLVRFTTADNVHIVNENTAFSLNRKLRKDFGSDHCW